MAVILVLAPAGRIRSVVPRAGKHAFLRRVQLINRGAMLAALPAVLSFQNLSWA